MEEIVGVAVEEIDVCHERFLDDCLSKNLVPFEPLDIHWKLDVFSLKFFVVINVSI